MTTNYELFISTVNMLKNSQGFYSRIAERLSEMSEDELKEVENQFNSLDCTFKDTVDVVMYLET